MTTISRSIDIDAPLERVWSVLLDVERWPTWTASMRSVRRLDTGPLAVGSRVKIRQPGLLPLEWRVTELEPLRGFTWTAQSPGVTVTGRHHVERVDGRTRAVLSVGYDGPLERLITWLTRNVNHRYLAMEAEGLKARSES